VTVACDFLRTFTSTRTSYYQRDKQRTWFPPLPSLWKRKLKPEPAVQPLEEDDDADEAEDDIVMVLEMVRSYFPFIKHDLIMGSLQVT
jgi:hypothetical protein